MTAPEVERWTAVHCRAPAAAAGRDVADGGRGDDGVGEASAVPSSTPPQPRSHRPPPSRPARGRDVDRAAGWSSLTADDDLPPPPPTVHTIVYR